MIDADSFAVIAYGLRPSEKLEVRSDDYGYAVMSDDYGIAVMNDD